ncbi:hypothetical protein [Deinococcus arenicola]|uniref:Uncharacterized protein n=1 Tax=Deinococcus arenicola TaxID=2994950 RepID=A0ABU4DU00_9DEIO|nr:hypothetical protein [Deinococcus sp. ZS9-10]MDV6375908.1 hypothetical protein [Deinococcus sp. ZS9-10]
MVHSDEQIITVHGAWHGQINGPDRMFKGKIVHSDLSGIRRGTKAEVKFTHSTGRSQSADEHGTYTLVVGSKTLPLMSFTCRTVGTTGQHSSNDAQEADWQAVPLG